MSRASGPRILARDELERIGEPRFGLQEVRQLWTFVDGAIMAVDTRHRLWRSWGLCPRHAWGYTVVEIELRGGRPFSTSVLYEDLIGRARRLLERTRLLPWPVVANRFRPRGICSTCDFLSIDPTYAEDHAERMTRFVNRLQRTREVLADLSPLWVESSCPRCLGGRGPVCLWHLLAGAELPDGREQLIAGVQDLERRLLAFGRSMTWRGRPATREEQASWVEVLGWFADWRFPALVLGRGGGDRDG